MAPADEVEEAPTCLRGTQHRLTDLMEALQDSYVRGVAAAAGCIVARPEIDEGVDLLLRHTHEQHNGDQVARLEVQMKATATRVAPDGKSVSARVSKDRYDYFRSANPSFGKILVIMHLPESPGDWCESTPDALLIRHRAYWINLEGAQARSTDTVTVTASTENIFDDIALCSIMERIGRGEKP
jgi:hypothetical protein